MTQGKRQRHILPLDLMLSWCKISLLLLIPQTHAEMYQLMVNTAGHHVLLKNWNGLLRVWLCNDISKLVLYSTEATYHKTLQLLIHLSTNG